MSTLHARIPSLGLDLKRRRRYAEAADGRDWFKDAVVYQAYPRTFHDANGDGMGDLRGIIEKLPYLQELGIDVLWLSPVYASPNDDNGYDVSDYRAIQPQFGTMADMEELIDDAHARGIKIMMDLVVNHTSDEHEWFKQSRSSKDNPYRDFYIWRDPRGFDGGGEDGACGEPLPPNNWGSEFGGSAWEYDEATGQFYLHMFSKKQPDLNWENPRVVDEVVDMIRWWQAKGVDGWRVDAICTADKPAGFPDDPNQLPDRIRSSMEHVNAGERIHEYLNALNRRAWAVDRAVTVGELAGPRAADGPSYTAPEREELDMAIHFEHMWVGNDEVFGKWTTEGPNFDEVLDILRSWEHHMLAEGGWQALYWENHDQPRSLNRFGRLPLRRVFESEGLNPDDLPLVLRDVRAGGSSEPLITIFEKLDDGTEVPITTVAKPNPDNFDELHTATAKLLATIQFFQAGTPYIYQGQELGMTNGDFSSIDDYEDLDSVNWYHEMVSERGLLEASEALEYLQEKSRDHSRIPVDWAVLDADHPGYAVATDIREYFKLLVGLVG